MEEEKIPKKEEKLSDQDLVRLLTNGRCECGEIASAVSKCTLIEIECSCCESCKQRCGRVNKTVIDNLGRLIGGVDKELIKSLISNKNNPF